MLTLLALGALAGDCALDAPQDAPFHVSLPPEAGQVHLLIEVWPTPASRAWAEGLFDALTAAGVVATLVVPVDPDPELIALGRSIREVGHAVAVAVPGNRVRPDPVAGHRAVRALLHPWKPVETVVIAGPSRVQEAVLGKAGVHEILRVESAGSGAPTLSAVFEGLPRTNVVLSAGPYSGDCGADPRVGPFTPAAADRAAQAIFGASGQPWATVRVALDGARATASDRAVLVRWLDEVIRPAGITPTTPPAVRLEARLAARDARPGESASVGRLVPVATVVEAAESLSAPGVELPRQLAGNLNLTESFQAFLLVSQGIREGEVVRLHALGGPIARAQSTLPGPVTLRAGAVAETGAALHADPPDALPSAFPCDGYLLTAAEFLLALAGAVRGEDPIRVVPIEVPDPNAPGLGWGAAGIP